MKSLTPHGPGFSFLDSCQILESGKRAQGSKWLDPKAPYFKDHFPEKPLMPGVLLVEAAAQAAGYLWSSGISDVKKPLFLAQVEQFRFLRPVLPNETLVIEVILEKDFGSLALFDAALKVGESLVAKGRITMGRMEA